MGLGLEKEDAVEIYYNAAMASWLDVSLNLQVIDTAAKKKVGSGMTLENIDTTVVGGLRARIRF